MSKSLGNVVDPIEIIDDIFAGQADPLRYFLLRSGKMNSDSPFSMEALKSCYNNELVGNLGNLISRMFKKYTAEEMASLTRIDRVEDQHLNSKLNNFDDEINELYDQFHFNQVADLSMDIISSANGFVSKIQPWKFTDSRDHFHVASQIAFIISKVSNSLFPIIPGASESIQQIIKGKKSLASQVGGVFPRILNKSIPRG